MNKIEAKDLRLGNLIRIRGDLNAVDIFSSEVHPTIKGNPNDVVYSISKTVCTLKEFIGNYQYDLLEGIPLTEKWLLKFGFFLTDISEYTIKLNDFQYLKIDEKLEYSICNLHNGDKIHMGKIKNVHEIQNLFFVLTGKELILNP